MHPHEAMPSKRWRTESLERNTPSFQTTSGLEKHHHWGNIGGSHSHNHGRLALLECQFAGAAECVASFSSRRQSRLLRSLLNR